MEALEKGNLYCYCCEQKTIHVEIEPADENLDSNGNQIKEFECEHCGSVRTIED